MTTDTEPQSVRTGNIDFSLVHCYCPICYPEQYEASSDPIQRAQACPGIGTIMIAICGTEVPHEHNGDIPVDPDGTPLNPCPTCLDIVVGDKPSHCGHAI